MKSTKGRGVKKARSKDKSGFVAVGLCLFILALIVLAIDFGGKRSFLTRDIDRITAVANLNALPPGYQLMRGSDTSNARAVWVDHTGARDDAHILIFMIQKGDPSSDDLNKYYAIHSGSPCDKAKRWHISSNHRFIPIVHTMCHPEGADMLEEQAIFPISPQYTALVDESAPKEDFDAEGFRAVVRTISYATGEGRGL